MKTQTEFVHLHVHSDYSLFDSTASVKALADRAEELGMKHLALTDHGNMFGIMDFLKTCKYRQNTINPIIGCEVYVAPNSRLEKKGNEKENQYYHLVLLAENRQGYLNLIKLCSLAYTEGFYYRPRVDNELLSQYHGGLIALSGCIKGEIPQLICEGKINEAEQKATFYNDLFGKDNFYLEIQDHGIPAGWLKCSISQKELNTAITGISRRTGIQLVATNDVHYIRQEDAAAHDVLLCFAGTGKLRNEENRKKYYGDQFYFKSGDEMAALFPEYPEAIANTVKIAERCVAEPAAKRATANKGVPLIYLDELYQYLPEFEIPQGGSNSTDYLHHIAIDGLAKRYPKEKEAGGKKWDEINKRLEYELDIIVKIGFTNYFLIVADYVNWAREHDIPVGPGRGSSGGSIVAYALHITNIDPLKYSLFFERFLNPYCISPPDIDIDFGNDGRDKVIKYITKKYGKERVAQIITARTPDARVVIFDVAFVLGISFPEAQTINNLIPFGITLKNAFDIEPKLKEMESDSRYTELFALTRKLEGLHGHFSLHATGLVIGKSDLSDIVPLFKNPITDDIATQYDMNNLESCGLVKFDFLGLKTLDVIKHTEELIRKKGGEYAHFTIEEIPEDDEAVFSLFGDGETDNVFQFASDGIKEILKKAKPEIMTDLIALNALYRPGPMQYLPQFIDSKNGKQEITYPDPCLEDILKETYGIIVYQEQIMLIIQRITGYSLGEANIVRRTLIKRDKERTEKEKERFITAALSHGFEQQQSAKLFDLIASFSPFAFNKSHAVAYTLIAYQTAYLKARFPDQYKIAYCKYSGDTVEYEE